MDQTDNLLTTQEQAALEKIAEQGDTNAQRAQALLYINAGMQHKEAAEAAGLTVGQANYALKKFRTQRLLAFPGALAYLEEATAVTKPEPELAKPVSKTQTRIDILLAELDKLVVDLRAALPDADNSPYSPLRLIGLVRENLSKYTPEVQLHILEQFEGMSREDLMDVDTWKGIAYMIAYSAQFQVSQTKDRLNAQMPQPLKPDTILQFIKDGLDRLMPEIAKDLAGTLEGASRDDLKDPDTWKGMVYMLSYSAQFQASQTKDKLNETLPGPIKPDTLWKLFKDSLNRVTPDVAKQIIASFEGATRDDLLDLDTWKGVWYMLNYSLQFQAEQIKVRLLGEAEEETK